MPVELKRAIVEVLRGGSSEEMLGKIR